MRLLKAKFTGKLLEGLELDFSSINDNSKAARFVILAGENGTGKTTILDSILHFGVERINCAMREHIWSLGSEDIEKIINANNEVSNSIIPQENSIDVQHFGDNPTLHVAKSPLDESVNSLLVKISDKKTFRYAHGIRNLRSNQIQVFLNGLQFKVWRNNTEPKMGTINNVSNYEIDNIDDAMGNQVRENIVDLNIGINVPQLLVDLDNKDAVEFRNKYIQGQQVDVSLAEYRMQRFKDAFNKFFDNRLVFKEVSHDHKVIFTKNNNEFTIEGLSSGEKMIVQCGASLLKDAGASDSRSVILIDEPEQALHPKWQERILDFYAKTASLNDEYSPQIIIATHSEHILRSALAREDALIILLAFDEDDRIKATRMSPDEYVLKYSSYNEIKYRAFGIISADYHDELLSFIQEEYGVNCKDLDSKLLDDSDCAKRHWCGKNRDGSLNSSLDTESLPLYIRHYTHHPELRGETYNTLYSYDELKDSILFLEKYIRHNSNQSAE